MCPGLDMDPSQMGKAWILVINTIPVNGSEYVPNPDQDPI